MACEPSRNGRWLYPAVQIRLLSSTPKIFQPSLTTRCHTVSSEREVCGALLSIRQLLHTSLGLASIPTTRLWPSQQASFAIYSMQSMAAHANHMGQAPSNDSTILGSSNFNMLLHAVQVSLHCMMHLHDCGCDTCPWQLLATLPGHPLYHDPLHPHHQSDIRYKSAWKLVLPGLVEASTGVTVHGKEQSPSSTPG